MKNVIHNTIAMFACGALISTQALAAGTVPGFGAAGTYNPALAAPAVAPAATVPAEDVVAGNAADGAGTAGAASAFGISTPVLVGGAVVLAAAVAIALGASSGSGGGSSTPTHASQ